MTMECLDKSPAINVGQTFVTKFGNITLVSITDNKNGVIKVEPIGGYTPIMRSTTDYQLESFYDGLITVKTNFFTLAGTGAHFWVCGYVDPGPEMCDQVFELKDQHSNPINGNVQIGTTAMSVIGTGTISLEQGKSFTAVASFGDQPDQSKAFTACTGTIVFMFEVPGIGYLSCYSVPTGATIFIDEINSGVTDKENIPLNAGVYAVRLEKERCETVNKIVTIILGVPGIVSVTLSPIGTVTGKELVFPFSKAIPLSDQILKWINKIVVLLGGKSAYIEDGNKIVVVL